MAEQNRRPLLALDDVVPDEQPHGGVEAGRFIQDNKEEMAEAFNRFIADTH